jgi:asparagine synthetase B (glutamine-hydrolysing)
MCGPAGIHHSDGALVDGEALLRMREHMHARGPYGRYHIVDRQKACIRSITADEVLNAIGTALDTSLHMQTVPTILHQVQQ